MQCSDWPGLKPGYRTGFEGEGWAQEAGDSPRGNQGADVRGRGTDVGRHTQAASTSDMPDLIPSSRESKMNSTLVTIY